MNGETVGELRGITRALVQSWGGRLWHSDRVTDWYTLPNPDTMYDRRDELLFTNLYCHERDGGFIVYYDRPRTLEAVQIVRCPHCSVRFPATASR